MSELNDTSESLERAAKSSRDSADAIASWHTAHGGLLPYEHDKFAADAARLDALAKALADLTSDDWWIESTPRGPTRLSCAEIVRERLERAP